MIAPRISVAMSVHNDELFLNEAIASILGQTFGDFELLIVNDGSTDSSGAIIDAYARQDSRIRAIHQPNRGLIASLNRLIEEARAPLIARMDGDDVSLPERFARQVAFLDAHPGHGVVGTNTHDLDTAGRVLVCDDFHPLDHDAIVAALEHGSPICHPSVMMRRAVVRAAGGYRPAYRHCEDYDLWLRLASQTRLANLPDRLIYYRRSPGQVSNRHSVAQQTGAAIARAAARERAAGRVDPTDGLDSLPPIGELDQFFATPGVAYEVRESIVGKIVYSRPAMQTEGFDILLAHIRSGGPRWSSWRTVLRLLLFGAPARATRLAIAMLRGRRRKAVPR